MTTTIKTLEHSKDWLDWHVLGEIPLPDIKLVDLGNDRCLIKGSRKSVATLEAAVAIHLRINRAYDRAERKIERLDAGEAEAAEWPQFVAAHGRR